MPLRMQREEGRVCRFPQRQRGTGVEEGRGAGAAGGRGRGAGGGLELGVVEPGVVAGEGRGEGGHVRNGRPAVLERGGDGGVDGRMGMDEHQERVDWTRRSAGRGRELVVVVVERRRWIG